MVMLSNDVFITFRSNEMKRVPGRPPCDGGDGLGSWMDSVKPRNMLRTEVLKLVSTCFLKFS